MKEPKKISCIWRRGKSELATKVGTFDPNNCEVKIDDSLRMNTGLEYDQEDRKYNSKMSVLELIFA